MRGCGDSWKAWFATVALGSALAGCASQHDDALRLSAELGRARAEAAAEQARAAALESRLSALERNAVLAASDRHAEERELSRRLDRLLELSARLLAEHAAASEQATASAPKSAASPPDAAASAGAASTLTDEQQLRALVEHMRGRPGRPHGGLTREQEAALQVLLRPERQLDTDALWAPALY